MLKFPIPLRLLTPTGWVVVAVALLAGAGWVKAWYWPAIQTRTITEIIEVPMVKEVVKWKTQTVTREVRIKEAPADEREKAKAREGDELLTAVTTPPAPHGGTAQAWLSREGDTRILFRQNPQPFAELGGEREISAWIGLRDDYAIQYRQDLGRIGPAHIAGRLTAENRRGEFGVAAQVGVSWRF